MHSFSPAVRRRSSPRLARRAASGRHAGREGSTDLEPAVKRAAVIHEDRVVPGDAARAPLWVGFRGRGRASRAPRSGCWPECAGPARRWPAPLRSCGKSSTPVFPGLRARGCNMPGQGTCACRATTSPSPAGSAEILRRLRLQRSGHDARHPDRLHWTSDMINWYPLRWSDWFGQYVEHLEPPAPNFLTNSCGLLVEAAVAGQGGRSSAGAILCSSRPPRGGWSVFSASRSTQSGPII